MRRVAALLLFAAVAYTQTSPPDKQIQSLIEASKLPEAETAARKYLAAHKASADAHYLLGYVLFKEDKPKESLAEYTEGARYRAPGALELEVIGSNYFLLEDYASADKWLSQAVEKNPNNPLALYLLGRAQYNQKHFQEAVQSFNRCLKLDPKNAKAQDNLGLSYEALGRTKDALAAYRSSAAYLHLGTLLVETNQPAEAVPYLLQAVRAEAGDARGHRELGKAYLDLNKLDQAQPELEKAAQLDPQSGPMHFLLAQVYRKRGMADKARIETERYGELTGGHSSPDDPLSEARSLVTLARFNDAEQVVRRYLEVHKTSADAHYLLGYILFKEEKAKASLAEYTAGAKYRTPSAHDLEVVGGDYVLLHDYSDADKWFSKSAEWNPGNLQTLYYLGRTKYNENRFEEAVAVFLQCLKLDPKNVKAEDNLGLSYQGMNRTEEAMTAYRTAIAWDKSAAARDSGPYIDLGTLLVDTNRASEAVPYLLQALEISPEEVRAHRELGKAYMHLNQLESAQKELEKSVALAPQQAPTHFVLAQVYRRRGLLDKARAETERYAALTGAHSTDQ
jgi:tetratricopeptide (TPR) repeat protein